MTPNGGTKTDGGGSTVASDPCAANAWAMSGGCRGREQRTTRLAPVSFANLATLPLSPDYVRLVSPPVVNGAGVTFFVAAGKSDPQVQARRSLFVADPTTKKVSMLRDLPVPSGNSPFPTEAGAVALALDEAGQLLAIIDGDLLLLDPTTGATKRTATIAHEPEDAADIVLAKDGTIYAATTNYLRVLDSATWVEKWSVLGNYVGKDVRLIVPTNKLGIVVAGRHIEKDDQESGDGKPNQALWSKGA